MRIAIASDHQGVGLKQAIKAFLVSLSHEVTDLGVDGTESADYPDYGIPLAEGVASSRWNMGILICKTGIGMSIAANKVAGARAALCGSEEVARLSREHNDSNILVLASMSTDTETAKQIVKGWLEAAFSGGRHGRRVKKITAYERSHAGEK